MHQMLTPNQLAELSTRLRANADRLIEERRKNNRAASNAPARKNPNERRGRPAKRIINPFVDLIGSTTLLGRYPAFVMDIIEGIARLNWHDRKEGSTEAAKPLSVLSLMNILASVEDITTTAVMEFTGLGLRHAQRYVKALELAVPRLLAAHPRHLIDAMSDRTALDECPFYLRRMYVEKTYRTLAGGEPLDEVTYCILDQHGSQDTSRSYGDPDGLAH